VAARLAEQLRKCLGPWRLFDQGGFQMASRSSQHIFVAAVATAAITAAQPAAAQPVATQYRPAYLANFPNFEPKLTPEQLPGDVDTAMQKEFEGKKEFAKVQRLFDLWSWQAFVSLNWPTDDHGHRLADAKDISAAPPAWTLWTDSTDVFLPKGAAPAICGKPARLRGTEGMPRGRSPRPARAAPLLQASHRAGHCRPGSSTRSDTTSAPAVAPDRRRPPQAPPHAAGAAVATRCGQAGNQGGMLSARQRREAWNVGLVQDLTGSDLYQRSKGQLSLAPSSGG
jgi:hypothetical protein